MALPGWPDHLTMQAAQALCAVAAHADGAAMIVAAQGPVALLLGMGVGPCSHYRWVTEPWLQCVGGEFKTINMPTVLPTCQKHLCGSLCCCSQRAL